MRRYDSRHTVAVLRKVAELSQGDLAKLVGCSKRTIQAIEIGRLKLSENLAVKIAHQTGIAMSWLLGGDFNTLPNMAFSDVPYSKKAYEQTRAAITAGKNPNPLVVSLSNEGEGLLDTAPVAMMAKIVGRTTTLLHPNMDYWLTSILSSIFAAIKVGQAHLAIYRLAEFVKEMKKEFGQRFDDEFTDDAAVVFEQGLQRIKMTELLVKKGESDPTQALKSSNGKQEPEYKDLLSDHQIALGLNGIDTEALWSDLNNVGERLKDRYSSAQKEYEALNDQIMGVFRMANAIRQKSKSSPTPRTRTQGASTSNKPNGPSANT